MPISEGLNFAPYFPPGVGSVVPSDGVATATVSAAATATAFSHLI